MQALTEAGTADPKRCRRRSPALELDVPYGPVTLDENRQGIIDTFVAQLVLDEETGESSSRRSTSCPVSTRPSAVLLSETEPPERDNTPCEERSFAWQGNLIEVVDGVPQR